MKIENEQTDAIDWDEIYVQLYAYTHSLLKTKTWFRGKKADSFGKGKQVGDYVSEAIEKYLTHPEKYNPELDRSLVNYIKLHIIRTLVGNDAKSKENKLNKDVYGISSDKKESDDNAGTYLDSVLPFAEALFDQEVDYNEIMNTIEKNVGDDEEAGNIFLGKISGMKRREIMQDFGMSGGEYDNGMRRLQTIFNGVIKDYELKRLSA